MKVITNILRHIIRLPSGTTGRSRFLRHTNASGDWGKAQRRPSLNPLHLHFSTHGTTTVEFALTIPFLLFFTLLLIQTTLVMSAKVMVNYAAFAATRSAIVTIPADWADKSGEHANEIFSDGQKYEHIREAAVFAIAPITPVPTSNDSTDNRLTYPDGTVTNRSQQRLAHANANTQIAIYKTILDPNDPERVEFDPFNSDTFGPRDPITVEVAYNFKLTMPLVKAIFEDYDDYVELEARYTLNNEGITFYIPPIPKHINQVPTAPNQRSREPGLFGDGIN